MPERYHQGIGEGKKLAFLAYALRNRWCELLADFQQFYHLDLMALRVDESEYDLRRASALAAQLPPEGRVKRAIDPMCGVTGELAMLRRIEYNQRLYAWAQSESGRNGIDQPEPVYFDGEQAAVERQAVQEVEESKKTAALFGLEGLEAVWQK